MGNRMQDMQLTAMEPGYSLKVLNTPELKSHYKPGLKFLI